MKLITNKSKNLLYRIVPFSNCTVQFGISYAIATQISADSLTALSYGLAYYKNSTYVMGGFSNNISKPEKITRTFTTPADLDYNQIIFGVNGKTADTKVSFPMDLKPSTTYTFTCNFTNITQGSISWKDMMLVEGGTAGDYEPYSYNLLDKWKYPATNTINGVTFTNNEDGTITANGTASADARLDLVSHSGETTSFSGLDVYSKLIYSGCPDGGSNSTYGIQNTWVSNDFTDNGNGGITNTTDTKYDGYYRFGYAIIIRQGYTANNLVFKPMCINLTEMYGAGNEPTTVNQFYTDYPELKVSPLGFIGLKNLEISNKNIKRLKYKTADGFSDLGIIPSNSGYILDKYNNLSEELLEENIEKDNINYHIPDKTNILLNKIEGKTNKIVQLLDKSKFQSTQTVDGITFTNNGNGTYTVNGKSTASGQQSSYTINSGGLTGDWLKGHKYLFYLSDKTDLNYSALIGGYSSFPWSEIGYTVSSRNPFWEILTAKESSVNEACAFNLQVKSGVTCTNELASPQVFDLTAMYGFGKEPTTVEQFKKDYPQFFDEKLDGIWNVRTSGISTTGKNLFDIDSVSFFTKVSNGEYKSNTYIGIYPDYVLWTPVDGTKQITISGYVKCPVDKNYRFAVLYEDGTEASSYMSSTGDYLYNSYTSDTSKKIKYVYLHYTNGSNEVYIKDVQIELNSSATTYEPYTENKIDLLSTQTLNGINGVNDYIEVIDKGNCLYDLKKTQNIDSVDLGTLDWNIGGPNFSSVSMAAVIKTPANNLTSANCVCDKYVNCPLIKSFVDGDFAVNTTGDMQFRNSTYTTAAAFKTAVSGTMFYYQLKTPVTTTIATNLTYNQVSAIRTNGGLLLVNDNNNQKYVQPDVTLKENYQYKN